MRLTLAQRNGIAACGISADIGPSPGANSSLAAKALLCAKPANWSSHSRRNRKIASRNQNCVTEIVIRLLTLLVNRTTAPDSPQRRQTEYRQPAKPVQDCTSPTSQTGAHDTSLRPCPLRLTKDIDTSGDRRACRESEWSHLGRPMQNQDGINPSLQLLIRKAETRTRTSPAPAYVPSMIADAVTPPLTHGRGQAGTYARLAAIHRTIAAPASPRHSARIIKIPAADFWPNSAAPRRASVAVEFQRRGQFRNAAFARDRRLNFSVGTNRRRHCPWHRTMCSGHSDECRRARPRSPTPKPGGVLISRVYLGCRNHALASMMFENLSLRPERNRYGFRVEQVLHDDHDVHDITYYCGCHGWMTVWYGCGDTLALKNRPSSIERLSGRSVTQSRQPGVAGKAG